MTETLHRPVDAKAEELARVDKQLQSLESLKTNPPAEHNSSETQPAEIMDGVTLDYENGTEAVRPVSPLAKRIRSAAERFATRLDRRAIAKSHDKALKQYRKDDHSAYVDHVAGLAAEGQTEDVRMFNVNLLRKEEAKSDRAEVIEGATLQLRALGSLAMDKTVTVAKEAGYIGIGLGTMGYKAAAKRAQGAMLKHEMAAGNRQFKKSYARETKEFDKSARQEHKTLLKQEKAEMKQAIKEDRNFERDMHRKRSDEKWDARKEAVIVKLEKGAKRAGEAYRATKETYETVKNTTVEKKRKLGAFTLKARAVGQDTVAARRHESNK